jgi:hypothetical protein
VWLTLLLLLLKCLLQALLHLLQLFCDPAAAGCSLAEPCKRLSCITQSLLLWARRSKFRQML